MAKSKKQTSIGLDTTFSIPIGRLVKISITIGIILLTSGYGFGVWVNENTNTLKNLRTDFDRMEQQSKAYTYEDCFEWYKEIKSIVLIEENDK